jgi:membrane protein DedA with SNARE-associated domain
MFNPGSPLLQFITSYGYIGLFGVVSVETFEFIFSVPIGPILIVLGNLAHEGSFNFFILWGIAWVAAMIGDTLGYVVGRYAGRPILHRFSRRWLKPEKLAKAEAYYFAGWGIGFSFSTLF